MRLFVYGQLKTAAAGGGDPPRTARHVEPAWMHGILHVDKGDAFLTDVGDDTEPPIRGQVMLVDLKEIEQLDVLEEPDWGRRQANTTTGERVWVYEYYPKVPPTAVRVTNFLAPEKEVQELVRDSKHGGPEK